ncbi:hypothetical protein C8A05DRAFT_14597 [Staphylotrichum tortipilum]|uniref:Tetraspanin n=1 Tax=Staphylotrichum tortipilum TaxID=2831512 RepID=A0AAN6MMN2_9PEZI|nr:hypothetical protein C8A05DRAFT_14597 [Staphylotrichum longicolle]
MANKIQLVYVISDGLFLLMGVFILAFAIIVNNVKDEVPTNGRQAARNLLYQGFPLTAGIVNAVFIFVTFLVTLPGLATSSRKWIKLAGYMAVVCAMFSMILGLYVWILTLKARGDFAPLFAAQSDQVKSLMQTEFSCCGYVNSTSPAFVTDATCPSKAAAAIMRGCATAISSFANVFLDNIFTALFGIVGFDAVFVMATVCLLKDRKERERFRHIDEKNGVGRI